MMVRLFAFAVFFGFAIWVVAAFVSFGGARPQQTYRPWPRWRFDDEPGGEPGTMHLVKRSELQALRDAYSSAPIDPGEQLLRCGSCLAMYHATSVHELDRTNGGRCVVCRSTDLAAVHVADG
jgi:hypothetical protein